MKYTFFLLLVISAFLYAGCESKCKLGINKVTDEITTINCDGKCETDSCFLYHRLNEKGAEAIYPDKTERDKFLKDNNKWVKGKTNSDTVSKFNIYTCSCAAGLEGEVTTYDGSTGLMDAKSN